MPSRAPLRARPYLIPLAALIPILPLLFAGPSCGHDFDFHILSWLEAARQLLHGHYPQWAYTPAYNAGEPRFLFYPPLSWLTGAMLGLALPWHYAPIAFTWLALTLSGLTLHRLALRYTTPTAATLAAVFYLANPYMLFTAYERTAYGELLAAAWIPLLLAAILAPRISIAAIAIPVGLLWITNAPAAVMSCYALALLALVRLATTLRDKQPRQTPFELTRNTILGVLLGLGLAAFYVLPAAWERGTIQAAMATVPGMRIADNTLFQQTTDEAHDAVLHTASMLAVVLLTATLATLAALREAKSKPALILLTLAIAFLLTPWSLPLWRHAPEAIFLQFPWRLLAILAAVLAFAGALLFRDLDFRPLPLALSVLGLTTLLTLPSFHHFNQPCDTPDTVEARYTLFHSPQGSDPTDEYTPATADNDFLRHANPPYWLGDNANAQPPASSTPGPLPDHLTLTAPAPETLILNRRQIPAWGVQLNGKDAALDPPGTRDDGLIALPIPAGQSTVALTLHRTTDENAGLAISLAALACLWLLRRKVPSA
ncbi:hypothetical protein FTO74_14480 [Granulicella sp. WH15]|uniref:hypothetical protein n=1 Tax=Granulicella sp. WH15 TaxID=2602070 RepID=UPI0013668CBC|nr:hypothetical protein [Granulicella sp. WH15]QHN04438.1 hypothetical protein FTO74_14480 [Granulicella sp. WH15]